jgi:carbon-monoxide dehydrogenase medium subunit
VIRPFEHQSPGSLREALDALAHGAVPYAGGTELLAAMKLGLLAPDRLVDLKRVTELAGVRVDQDRLIIGAGTTHAAAERDPELRGRLPMLAKVLAHIGNPRVRWQGTLGGNLCFAEPRSDLAPALIALGATLTLQSRDAERSLHASAFATDAFTVDRNDNELLTEITIDTSGIVFQRYERIQLMERPTAGVALVGRSQGWRLCVGAVGYVPTWHDASGVADIDVAEVISAVEPIDDSSGSAEYKRHLVGVLVRRLVAAAGGPA